MEELRGRNAWKELTEMLNRFHNENADFCEDNKDMDSYYATLFISDPKNPDIDLEIDFWEELDKVMKAKGIEYDIQYCGGFDSPGYDLSCYCVAFINEGKIDMFPVKFEIM